jgi:CBS domain-containing protein
VLERNGTPNWEYLPVREVMNENPITVSPKMKVNFAASLMEEKDVSSLIVTRKDEPIGTLSEKDITRKVVAKDIKPNQVTVKEIMSRPVVTVSPDEDLASVARTMAKQQKRIVAVVENRKLIGVVSQRALFSISPTLLELSREHARINNNGPQMEAGRTGYCELCHSYSEELEEKSGLMICPNCN